jgi:Tat protein translocase TatB subunit
MFGMGWQEILLILVVAVLVIGPDQLPQVARTIGKLVAQFRRMTNDLRDQVNREFTENEDFKDFREFHHSIDTEVRNIGYTAQSYVEKEVAKEEAELTKLEQEVREDINSGPLGDPPGEPLAAWTDASNAFPAEEPMPEPAAETAPMPDDDGKTVAEAEPVERDSTRKESA